MSVIGKASMSPHIDGPLEPYGNHPYCSQAMANFH